MKDLLEIAGYLLAAGLGIFACYLGATKKAVFYRDIKDCLVSFAVWIVVFILMMVAASKPDWNPDKALLTHVTYGVCIIAALYNIAVAFITNKGTPYAKYAIFIGIMRVVLGIVFIATLIEIFGGKQTRSHQREMGIAMAIVLPLIYLLINGEAVAKSRQLNNQEGYET